MATNVSGPLKLVTDQPATLVQVSVRAPRPRPHAGGMVVDFTTPATVTDGEVEFPCVPGPAVMSVMHAGVPQITVPLVVPDKPAASLEECMQAADLADNATQSVLEDLARRIVEGVASAEVSASAAAESAAAAGTDAREVASAREIIDGYRAQVIDLHGETLAARDTASAAAETATTQAETATDRAGAAAESAAAAGESEANAAASATDAKNAASRALESSASASESASSAKAEADRAASTVAAGVNVGSTANMPALTEQVRDTLTTRQAAAVKTVERVTGGDVGLMQRLSTTVVGQIMGCAIPDGFSVPLDGRWGSAAETAAQVFPDDVAFIEFTYRNLGV